MNPAKFILLCLAGWMQREQQAVIDYLQEEVCVLKEAFGEKQPRLNDAQRIRLAAKAKKVKFGRLMMRLATREVHIAGIADQPNAAWATQAVRNLCDGLGGFLNGCRFLIHDRDPLFGIPFDHALAGSAIESVRLPSRSLNLNAYAERFVRSIQSECLDQMVFFSERSLLHAIREFAEHYHRERNHQGLDNRIIRPEFVPQLQHGEVRRRARLGGLLNFYYRQAA